MCRREIVPGGGSSAEAAQKREVLPTNVKPTHYDLTLEPDFDKFTYDGHVVIDVDVKEDTTSISLNTLEIEISSAKVTSGETTISSSPELDYHEDSQTLKVSFKESIKAGSTAQLHLTFKGILNDKMAGFYRSSYKGKDGEEVFLATSQMEPTDCRRAFPCFDEPALKAEFTVTLIADEKMTCLSNMNVAKESQVESKMTGQTRKAVKFERSPPMSTYLVAFIVGELKYIETNAFRVPIRVYLTPDQDIEHGRFSLDLAAKILPYYEQQFGLEYPLPKMDMVGIPDFAAGAMENYGLITYRIVDIAASSTVSAATKTRVSEVVAHELAHQWFGNSTTMDWWDGLWLNESFATWASWDACNAFFPEWKVWSSYVTNTLQGALALDSLRSSHPIDVPILRAEDVNAVFDAISYNKGSCMIRQISRYIGEDKFKVGVSQYLKNHTFGTAKTEDLWAALSDASGKDVEKFADIWTKNIGYPVVSVSEDEKTSQIGVKQNRFLRTGDVKPEEDKILYPVPLGLRTKDGVDEALLLEKREQSYKVPDLDFFKLNADHTGVYRTSYTPDRLTKLGQNAKDGLLTVEDRAGMIADAGALSAAGYGKTSGLLSLLKNLDTESEFVVWDEIVARIGAVRAAWIFEDQATKDALKTFQRDLVSARAHKLGWTFADRDGHIEQQFKALMFGSAASAGDEKTKAAAFEMFNKFVDGDTEALHPNLRGSVYAIVLQYGGEKEYNAVLQVYQTAKESDQRNTALRAIGRAKDAKLIKRTLDYALSKEVKDQDIHLPLSGLRTHAEGIVALWEWEKANWDTLKKKLPPSLSMFGNVVTMGTSGFTKESQLKDVESFFEGKSTKGFDRNLAQSYDAVKAKIGWIKRDSGDVVEWLKAQKYL